LEPPAPPPGKQVESRAGQRPRAAADAPDGDETLCADVDATLSAHPVAATLCRRARGLAGLRPAPCLPYEEDP